MSEPKRTQKFDASNTTRSGTSSVWKKLVCQTRECGGGEAFFGWGAYPQGADIVKLLIFFKKG